MRKNLATIVLMASALLIVLLLIFHLRQTSKEKVLSQFNENQLLSVQRVARPIERYLGSRSQDLRWLAFIASQQADDRDRIAVAIRSNFNRLKMTSVQEVSLLNEKGTVVYSTTAGAKGKNHSQADFFSWARNPGNRGAVRMWYEKTEGPRRPVTAGSPVPPRIEIFLATPLYRESNAGDHQQPGGKFAGALMFMIDLEQVIAERSPSLTPETKFHKLWIMERSGTLLVHSGHPEMVMRDIRKRDQTCNECHTSFDYIETILGKAEGTIEYQIRGKPKKVAAFTSMSFEKISWVIVMNSPLDEVTAFESKNFRNTLFLLGAVVFLLGLGFVITYSNYRQKLASEMEVTRLRETQAMLEALRESEEKYRTLFESSRDAIMILVPPSWRITAANPATVEMFEAGDESTFTTLGSAAFSPEFQPDGRPSSGKAAEIIQTAMTNGSHFFDWTHRRLGGEPFPATVLLTRMEIGGQALLQVTVHDVTKQKQADKQLQDTLESLRKAVGTTIQVIASTVEARDPYTAGHQIRSAALARTIATEIGLSQDKIDGIWMAGSIHDIGKISIPAEILSKPTKLSDIEFALIKEHARKGYEMLKDVESPLPLAEIVYQHHELMDGSGYPRNLKGEEILIEARILTVADVVEAMASDRPYRPGLGIDAALNEIEKNRGIFYDVAAADACLRLFREKGYKLEGIEYKQ